MRIPAMHFVVAATSRSVVVRLLFFLSVYEPKQNLLIPIGSSFFWKQNEAIRRRYGSICAQGIKCTNKAIQILGIHISTRLRAYEHTGTLLSSSSTFSVLNCIHHLSGQPWMCSKSARCDDRRYILNTLRMYVRHPRTWKVNETQRQRTRRMRRRKKKNNNNINTENKRK